MLIFLLCSTILYRFIQNVGPNQTESKLPFKFGFKKDGNYTISIKDGGNESFVLFIRPNNNEKYIKDDKLQLICTNSNFTNIIPGNIINIIHKQNGRHSISGFINVKNIYKTSILSCTNRHNGFQIEGIYMNPNSPFGYEALKALKCFLALIYIRAIIFMAWIINWICHFSLKNQLHNVLTFTAFIYLLSRIIDYFGYKKTYESNQASFITTIRPVVDRIRNIVSINTYFLMNCCFCIAKNSNKNTILKIIFMWCFYLIFYPFIHLIFNVWLFYIFGIIAHIFVNDFIIILSGVYDDDDEIMIFIINQLFSLINVLLLLYEKSDDMYLEIELYVVIDSLVIIGQCINAYFFRMRNNTKNDYLKLFPISNKNYHMLPKPTTRIANTYNKIITIPKNVTQINRNIFNSFSNFDTVYFEEESHLQIINSFAFQNLPIKYIKIPPSVKEIADFAFSNCSYLQYIEFMEDSHILTFNNILNNSSINRINIPSSLVEIKYSWCSNIKNLNYIDVSPRNHFFILHNGNFILQKLDKNSFVFDALVFARRDIQNAIIPSYIKKINPNAFKQCQKIRHLEFSTNSELYFIGENAFSESSINEIIIPKNVSIIESSAFKQCKHLTRIDFENNSTLLSICDYAFKDTSIERINIPSHTITIGKNAFENCSKLKQVNISDNSNLTMIDRNAFDHSAIESFIVTSKVNFIGEFAFANCKNFQIIEFQEDFLLYSPYDTIFKNSSQVIIMIPAKVIVNF